MGGGPKEEKILIALPFPEPVETIERIKKTYPYAEITYLDLRIDRTSLTWSFNQAKPDPEIFLDKTIIVTFATLPAEPSGAPKLDWVHFTSAGTNHVVQHPIYTDTNITLTTSSGVHGPQIAEWVVLNALAFSHNYNGYYENQKQKSWNRELKHKVRVEDFAGQRVGILGYGSIGRQTGRLFKALGSDVIAYTAHPKNTPAERADHGWTVPGTGDLDGSIPSAWFSGLDKASLHKFLSQDLDVLVISVPLTKDTFHFIGAEEFAVLSKRKAFVTNISRGDIINQPALKAALESGQLRGAAIDVTTPEPLPADDPLWDAPNLTITPHISGEGSAYAERALAIFETNLAHRDKGERLINVIDRRQGY